MHAMWCALNSWINTILNKIMITELVQQQVTNVFFFFLHKCFSRNGDESIGSCDFPNSNFKMRLLSFLRCLTARALSCPTSTRAQTRCMGHRVWRSRLKVTWLLQTRGTTALKCIATCSSAPALLLSLSFCFARSAKLKPLNQTI